MVRRQRSLVIYSCALNVLSDLASKHSGLRIQYLPSTAKSFIVMALPLAMLKRLQMRTLVKVGLAVVFCFALIIITFDILRAVETETNGGTEGSIALWTNLELAVAVIVSCFPSLTALFNPKNEGNGGKNWGPYKQRSLVQLDSATLYVSAGNSVKSGYNGRASPGAELEKVFATSGDSMQGPAADGPQRKAGSMV